MLRIGASLARHFLIDPQSFQRTPDPLGCPSRVDFRVRLAAIAVELRLFHLLVLERDAFVLALRRSRSLRFEHLSVVEVARGLPVHLPVNPLGAEVRSAFMIRLCVHRLDRARPPCDVRARSLRCRFATFAPASWSFTSR